MTEIRSGEVFIYRENAEGNMGEPLAQITIVARKIPSEDIPFTTREGAAGTLDLSRVSLGFRGQRLIGVKIDGIGSKDVAVGRRNGVGFQTMIGGERLVVQVVPAEALRRASTRPNVVSLT